MSIVLTIFGSPRGARSVSSSLSNAFLDEYRNANPGDEIRRINVFERPLPEFGDVHAEAKFARIFGREQTAEEVDVWKQVLDEIMYFDEADKIVLSCPMWNFSIPWKLKQYFDVISQPGITFGYDPIRMVHIGLLRNRPVQLLLSRSSTLPGDFTDFQLPYLRFMFGFMGLNDVRAHVAWQTTKFSEKEREEYRLQQMDAARAASKTF